MISEQVLIVLFIKYSRFSVYKRIVINCVVEFRSHKRSRKYARDRNWGTAMNRMVQTVNKQLSESLSVFNAKIQCYFWHHFTVPLVQIFDGLRTAKSLTKKRIFGVLKWTFRLWFEIRCVLAEGQQSVRKSCANIPLIRTGRDISRHSSSQPVGSLLHLIYHNVRYSHLVLISNLLFMFSYWGEIVCSPGCICLIKCFLQDQ